MDRRSDVWSFGCILFECLTGRPALDGETASDLIAKILEREPEWAALPTGSPARVREILRRCLRKDATARPRDIRDVRLELEGIAAGGSKADAERPVPSHSTQFLRRGALRAARASASTTGSSGALVASLHAPTP